MYKKITTCRVCGNPALHPIIDLGTQVLTGVFPKDRYEEITAGPLELVKCMENTTSHCGLVQLRYSYDSIEMYGHNYGYRSGLNRSMVKHLQEIVARAQKFVMLSTDDLIIDIGSNDGTLLKSYPHGQYALVGIDPTAAKFAAFYPENITVIPDFFTSKLIVDRFKGKKAKIITSIAMFYDLENPLEFVSDIYTTLADQGIWVFEQSYLPLMLARNAYDTICHEHLEYYGLKQVKWLLDRVGLKIIHIELTETNGGSFKVTAAKANSPQPECTALIDILLEQEIQETTLQSFETFKTQIAVHKEELIDFIHAVKRQNKKILGYGASTKGNVILQHCGLTGRDIPYIAEVNEDKFGKFTPGTYIPIISEQEAKKMKPDYLLVLPWHFRENILEREKAYLSAGGHLVFPLPNLEII